jgi:hypothetical protein
MIKKRFNDASMSQRMPEMPENHQMLGEARKDSPIRVREAHTC